MSRAISGAGNKLTHAQALALLTAAGITLHSSGNCSDKNNPHCTSLDGIRQCTVDGVIHFKQMSNCGIVITGGTEVGHAGGVHSHAAGYKVDIRLTKCVTDFIKKNFAFIGLRPSDQAEQYDDGTGNIYAEEMHTGRANDHWDVTYLVC